jgi:hypothetical protein
LRSPSRHRPPPSRPSNRLHTASVSCPANAAGCRDSRLASQRRADARSPINPFILTKDGKVYAPSTPRSISTTTPCSATKTCSSCATSTKKIRSKSRRPSSASTTSSSMATWPAW